MAAPASRSLGQLLRQGWNEIPEVVGSTVMGMIAIPLGVYATFKHYENDGDNKRYKTTYVIMRPDDPRVARIRKD